MLPIPKHTRAGQHPLRQLRRGAARCAGADAASAPPRSRRSIPRCWRSRSSDVDLGRTSRAYFPDDPASAPTRRQPGRVRRRRRGGRSKRRSRRIDGGAGRGRPGQRAARLHRRPRRGRRRARSGTMRKKSVGLLGNMQGDERPMPSSRTRRCRRRTWPTTSPSSAPRSTRAASSTACSATSMPACCTCARRIDMKDPAQERADPRDHRRGRRAHAQVRRRCSGASTARACAPSSSPRVLRPALSRRCRRSRPPSTRATSSTPARSPRRQDRRLLRIDGVPTRGQLDRTIPAPVRAGVRRGAALQRQRRLLQLRSGRRDVPVVEGARASGGIRRRAAPR